MSHLAEALAAAAHDLDELGVASALVGGLAVSTWCDPRLTRDIDVAVSGTANETFRARWTNCCGPERLLTGTDTPSS